MYPKFISGLVICWNSISNEENIPERTYSGKSELSKKCKEVGGNSAADAAIVSLTIYSLQIFFEIYYFNLSIIVIIVIM